ncbi:hypothetical protein ACFFG4_09080 [Micromonospora costi]
MLASVPWIVVLLGVATLATLLLVASLSFRVREPEPVAASVPPLDLPIAPVGPSTSASASPTPEPTRSTAAPARPSRMSTRPSPAAPRSSGPPPAAPSEKPGLFAAGALTATYRVRDADRYGVVAEVQVHNDSGRAEEWTVRLRLDGRIRDVDVSGDGRVRVDYRGDGRYLLRGTNPLPDGESVTLELRFSRNDGDGRLVECTVNGNDCAAG